MNWSRPFAVVLFFAATPAVAQPYPSDPYYGGVVSPREVMRTVSSLGLQPASEPHLRGNVWVVRGIGREGTMVRVVVDSHTGRIVTMHALRGPEPYDGPYGRPGPYQPDPRYVMRDEPYGAPGAYPTPHAGETYQEAPYGPGANAGPARGAAMPADDDDDYDRPMPQPRGYVPPNSSYSPNNAPRISSKPEVKHVAAKPASAPLPKARPDEIKNNAKLDTSKTNDAKQDGKKDEAKSEEPKKDEPKQAQAPLTSPKSPEVTGSVKTEESKPPLAQPKKDDLPPVQPLE
jgi:hypothetical protein